MPQDRDDLFPAVRTPAPTAADFDEVFSAAAASPGIRRVWELAAPDLPPQVEPFSFASVGLLWQVAQALDLSPGQTLVDLGCGRYCPARALPTSRWRPSPNGTTCGPASTGWPSTSAIPVTTPYSPICKTRPGSDSRWRTSSARSPLPRPHRRCRSRTPTDADQVPAGMTHDVCVDLERGVVHQAADRLLALFGC